jgi:hypothetical protein
MMATSTLPQARVVRKAGQLVTPPPQPKRPPSPLAQQIHVALQIAFGLWPLTAVVLLLLGLLYYAGMNAAP